MSRMFGYGGRMPRPSFVVVLLAFGVVALARGGRGPEASGSPEPCATGDPCGSPVPDAAPDAPHSSTVLRAADACLDVGYLCADLRNHDRIRIERWKDFAGTLVVYVPKPEFEDPAVAMRLQNAAAAGIRAWNGQPFPIYVDERGDRQAHFAVRWTRSLAGTQIGVAHTQWSARTGRQVLSIELTTRSPYAPGRVVDPEQIRLTAAHEMGHALGLPHSDSERDVMYPTNTASSLSARDYVTMEALYALPDGTEIVP